jgi:hypothetical protein
MTMQGVDPTDTTQEAIAQKVAWVREAAGERFAQLELCMLAFHLVIRDDRTRVQERVAEAMSVDQAVEHFLEQRERYGFSSILLFDEQMESFAPVVARLTGK